MDKDKDKNTRTKSFDKDSLNSVEISANYYLFRIFSTIFFCFDLKQKPKNRLNNDHWLSPFIENSESDKKKKNNRRFTEVVIETQLMNKMSRDWSEIIREKKKEKAKLIEEEEKKRKELAIQEIQSEKIEDELEMDNFSDNESINIDELVSAFIENTRNQQMSQNFDDEHLEISLQTKFKDSDRKTKDHKVHKKRTMNEYFQQKLISDLIKNSNGNKNEKKKETYHSKLLERGLDCGINGKMVQYTDNHAYNSDDSSDCSEEFESSLFYRYGGASRFVDDSLKNDLIKRNSNDKQKNKRANKQKHLKDKSKKRDSMNSYNGSLNR